MSTSTLEIKAVPDSVKKPASTRRRATSGSVTKKNPTTKKTVAAKTAKSTTAKKTTKPATSKKAFTKSQTAAKKTTKRSIAKKTAVKKTIKKTTTKKSTRPTTTKAKVAKARTPLTAAAAAAKLKADGALGLKRHPLGHLLLEQKLHEAGFKGDISTDKHLLDRYSTDESIFSIRPQVVLQPKTQDDINVATAVIAKETKNFASLSLTPRAAGTGLSGGSLTDSVVIDVCAHLHQIGEISHHQDEVHITVEPGVMWRDMEHRLKRAGYYVPCYASSKDIASVGGAVGNNSAGAETLRYGHCADWVTELDIVLHDGKTYTVKPLTFAQYKKAIKKKSAYATILQNLFSLLEKNAAEIKKNHPKTHKNTAGYNLWDVLPQGVAAFKKGKGQFNPIKLVAGSQGTIGIVSSITMRAIPLPQHTTLLVVPVFDLQEATKVIKKAKTYGPLDMELFDDRTFDLALQNPQYLKRFTTGLPYYRSMFALYTMYHVRFQRKLPEFFIMITLDEETTRHLSLIHI